MKGQKPRTHEKSQSNKNQSPESPTPVLLVCVNNINNQVITHDKFFKCFSQYGNVLRILIFERQLQWKSFIEMDSSDSAQKALQNLNNKSLLNDDSTKMNVYFSSLKKIVFQENNSGGVDYTILRQKIMEKKQNQKISKQMPGNHPNSTNSQDQQQQQPYQMGYGWEQQGLSKFNQGSNMEYASDPYSLLPGEASHNIQMGLMPMNGLSFIQPSQMVGGQYPSGESQMPMPVNNGWPLTTAPTQFNAIMVNQNMQPIFAMNVPSLDPSHAGYLYEGQLNQGMQATKQTNQAPMGIPQSNSQGTAYSAGNQICGNPQSQSNQLSVQTNASSQLKTDAITGAPNQGHQNAFTASANNVQTMSTASNSNSGNQKIITPRDNSDLFKVFSQQADNRISSLFFQEEDEIIDSNSKSKATIDEGQDPQEQQMKIDFDFENLIENDADPDSLRRALNLSNAQQPADQVQDTVQQFSNLSLNSVSLRNETNNPNSGNVNRNLFTNSANYPGQSQAKNLPEQGQALFSMPSLQDVGPESEIAANKQQQKQNVINIIEKDISNQIVQKTEQSIQQIDSLIGGSKVKKPLINPHSMPFQPDRSYQPPTGSFQPQIQQTYTPPLHAVRHKKNQKYAPKSNFRQSGEQPQQYQNAKRNTSKSPELYEDITSDMDPGNYVNPLFLKATRKSKVIYARWFQKEKVTMKMLYNIFSTFGNIERMIFFKDKSSVLIEYQQVEQASIAKEYLNDIEFQGNQIKIFYSNYEEIYVKDTQLQEQQIADLNEEYFIGSQYTHRFKKDKNIVINPISDTLHISNLKKEACDIHTMQKLFSHFGKINAHRFIIQENNQKNMCVLKFDNKEIAFNILANMHNTELYGRQIQISFSKLRLSENPQKFSSMKN